jgi:histidinol dehydrogenase
MLELMDAREELVPFRIERPPRRAAAALEAEIRDVVEDVRLRGDAAVLEHTSRSGHARLTPDRLRVAPEDIASARSSVTPGLIEAIEALVTTSRRRWEHSVSLSWTDRGADATIGELVRPLRRVGIHIARGSSGRLSGLIATVQAAQVAGVEGIAVCSAPEDSGEISDPVMAACSVCGINEVYRAGGAQAIAAMAYGTETVRPVDKVVGIGGTEVACAQMCVRGWVGTGPEAGPSELLIVADETSSPQVLAADLIANAAAGPQGSHVIVTALPELLQEVVAAVEVEVATHDHSGDVENALIEGGRGVLVRDLDQALEVANAFAPGCLMLSVADPETSLTRVRDAGSVLLGAGSPVAAAPFFGGAGELWPSEGRARWESGVSPRDFVKTIAVSGTQRSALPSVASHVHALAQAEGDGAGVRALDVRVRS